MQLQGPMVRPRTFSNFTKFSSSQSTYNYQIRCLHWQANYKISLKPENTNILHYYLHNALFEQSGCSHSANTHEICWLLYCLWLLSSFSSVSKNWRKLPILSPQKNPWEKLTLLSTTDFNYWITFHSHKKTNTLSAIPP